MRIDAERAAPSMPPGKVEGPSAWLGPEVASRDDWKFSITPDDQREVEHAVEAFERSGRPLIEIRGEDFQLPSLGPRLKKVLHELLQGRGFVMLHGLDISHYSKQQVAIAYLGLGTYFGSFRSQNAKGHLLGHVKDQGLDIADPRVRFYQTSRKLGYHTDSSDLVALLCLKTARMGGESFIASSVTCYNELLRRVPHLLPKLFDPMATDRRGEVPPGEQPWFDVAVFNWYQGKLITIYGGEYIKAAQQNFPQAARLTTAHWEALEAFEAILDDPAVHLSMPFHPGDIQILNNHQVLHARNDFVNWPEPERHRHKLRLWISPPYGQALPPSFAPRYGNLRPGDRGGIVVDGMKLTVPLDPE